MFRAKASTLRVLIAFRNSAFATLSSMRNANTTLNDTVSTASKRTGTPVHFVGRRSEGICLLRVVRHVSIS